MVNIFAQNRHTVTKWLTHGGGGGYASVSSMCVCISPSKEATDLGSASPRCCRHPKEITNVGQDRTLSHVVKESHFYN